jgi:hypothetical protein
MLARYARHLPLAFGGLLILLIMVALAAPTARAQATSKAVDAGHDRLTVVLGADGAGVAIAGNTVEARLGDTVAPDDRVERTADGLRILAEDGATMVEARLAAMERRTDLRWIWSPRAWSTVDLRDDVGLSVRGLSRSEAARLGVPRDGALAVTEVAAASYAAAAPPRCAT